MTIFFCETMNNYIKISGVNMKKIIFFLLLTISVLFIACQNKNEQPGSAANNTKINKDTSKIIQDTAFLDEAAEGGMMMVKLGRTAEQKAHSKAIKDFGSMMVNDHSQVDDELKSLAQQHHIALPDSLSKDKQEKIDDLAKLSERKFEKQYVDMMVADHQNDVAKFKEESQDAASPEVRQWAANTLPILQKHLNKIKEIQKKYNF